MSHRWHSAFIILSAFMLFSVCGCGTFTPDGGMASPSGGFGATQGGVQDMGLARELVANDLVPPIEAFTVEGMFSEHDLPLEGDTDESVLNLQGGLGLAPDLAGISAGWLQVGMSSNINPDSFQRPTMSVIACVDVSGSMGRFYGEGETEYPTPGSISRLLLSRISRQLDENDRISIVTFGANVSTLLAPVTATSSTVSEAISELTNNGSTNMEAGLIRAYSIAQQELESATEEVRVLLFTDMQPNVGETSGNSFRGIVGRGADDSIGISVFGMGVGLGQDVMNVISNLRGGNSFSLFETEDVDELIEMNWPWVFVPIAHDLSLEIEIPSGITVESAYGFPGFEQGDPGFTVASVFPSHRKGALLACLKPEEGSSLHGVSVTGHLTFTTTTGSSVTQDLTWDFPDVSDPPESMWFDQITVGKTVALAVFVSGMKSAAENYGTDPDLAIETMQSVLARITSDADSLADETLTVEVQLAADLLALMESGARQGNMY